MTTLGPTGLPFGGFGSAAGRELSSVTSTTALAAWGLPRRPFEGAAGRQQAVAASSTVFGQFQILGANTTRVVVDMRGALLQFGALMGNTTTPDIQRSVAGRLQALGQNVTAKDVGTTLAGLVGSLMGPMSTIVAGVATAVEGRLAFLGENVTLKAITTSVSGRLGALGEVGTTIGNVVQTTVRGALAPLGQNTTVGAAFVRRHVREQIRDQYVSALTIGIPEVAGRVYAARVYPIASGEFPGIVVFVAGDEIIEQTLGEPQMQVRRLELAVQGVAKASTNLDAELDDLAMQIEQVLADDALVSGLAKDSDLVDTEIEMVAGDKPHGTATLTFAITYVVNEDEPWLPL